MGSLVARSACSKMRRLVKTDDEKLDAAAEGVVDTDENAEVGGYGLCVGL